MEVATSSSAILRARRRHDRILAYARTGSQETDSHATSCATCMVILRLLNSPSTLRIEERLSPSAHQASNDCLNHAPVLSGKSIPVSEEVVLRRPAHQRLVYVHPDPYRNNQQLALAAPWEGLRTGESVPLFSSAPEHSQPRLLDRDWIDLDLLRNWIQQCEEHHADSCGKIDSEEITIRPHVLVDTIQRCLVEAPPECRYVALSYVWGHANAFLATAANYDILSEPNALANTSDFGVQLPQTIHHAIELTHALGERYLWVDALCIIREGNDWIEELNDMASLFANASLTLVAAQGQHADSGFQGLPNISSPRSIQQHVAPLLPEQSLVKPSSRHVWDDTLLRPWSTRAWTFQEAICSRRMLHFAHGSVRWCCRKARWSEESNSPDCVRSHSTTEQRMLNLTSPTLSEAPLPMLDEYLSLVNGYNIRDLTYAQDALAAFAGVATRLGKKFSGGLLSGLPEVFFDICLLWRPMRRLGPAILRETNLSSLETHLPTWSWAAWMTEIIIPFTWVRHRDLAGPLPILIGRTRPFYRVQIHWLGQDGSKTLVRNSWFDFACAALDSNLPHGWSSHSIGHATDVQDYAPPSKTSYYTHASQQRSQFWFPVPLETKRASSKTPKLLQFQSWSARFRLGESRRSMTRIYSLAGVAVGTMYPHDEADPEYVRATSGPLSERPAIELIAILGCAIPTDEDLVWSSFDGPPPTVNVVDGEIRRIEDVYSVIWITRSEGIAYRRATGVVKRRFWEDSERALLDITLG